MSLDNKTAVRILIVDDHESVRLGLRSLLSFLPGWEICGEAVDGMDAVQRAKTLRPDIILMDVSMPRMNGLDAARILRKELPATKVVILSQNDPIIVRRQAKEVDAAAFVPKIDLARTLLPTLTALMEGERAKSRPDDKAELSNLPGPRWLEGGGELGRLIRNHDWSKTPLGPLEQWPQSLKTSLNLILNSQQAMWLGWGPEATFLYNDAYIEILSSAKHPWALGRPAAEVWSEIWDICGPLADKVFANGEATFVDDVRFFMRRGEFLEEKYFSFSYSPIREESGNVGGLFCPNNDITEKILNARRLRTLSELSAEALMQKTIEAACASVAAVLAKNPDDVPFAALYLIDGERKGARLEQVCGVARGIDALTSEAVSLGNEEDEKSLWHLSRVVNTGASQVVPFKDVEGLPLGVAQQRLSQAIVLPVTAPGEGGMVGVLVCGINPARKLDAEYRTFYELVASQSAAAIQNARAAEEERKRLEAMAEIDRAKTAFFSNVSHEFRTPLTLMLGPVEELLSKSHTDLSPAAKSQLELVNRNGSRLLRLVNTLLDFSRIEAGRMQAIYQPTDLAGFTAELSSVFRAATERAGLELELDCPTLSEPVYLDRGMWEKIVLNLISNAFKFTFEGKIAVSLARAGKNVELRVRDTGVGIPANELPRLFDRFHRIENTRSRTHEGSGIGLALVQELVKLHGGSVRVESEPGKGSTFIVSMPLGKEHLPADRIGGVRTLASTAMGGAPFLEEALRWLPEANLIEAENEVPSHDELLPVPYSPLSSAADGGEKRPYILVADDNADMRQYLLRLLGERYQLKSAPDGQAALAAIAEHTPDLVLSDVMMPNLDGFGLLRELRSRPATKTIPIILLSARAGEESRIEGMERGADDYLIKPFSARELLARVQTHLEMARIRKDSEDTLRQNRHRFEMVARASQIGFWFCDLPFDKLTWDNKVKEHFWLPPDAEVTMSMFYERIHPHDRERTRQAIDESIASHTAYDIEYRTLAPDGRQKWIRAIGRTFYDAAGAAKTFDGLTLDITQHKEAEDRERQVTAEAVAATAKFRAVFEQTPVFAGIVALDGTLLDANRLCLDACGFRAEDVLGHPFWKTGWWRLSPEVQDKIRAAVIRAAEGIPYEEMLSYHWADGTERLVNFAIHPIRDHTGRILFLHPTGVDITDLKRAEENYRTLAETLDTEVRARTRELEQRNVEVLQQSEQLRDLSQRLLQIQDEERRRIARELHDSAGQLLAALGMNLARVAQEAGQHSPRLAKDTEDSQQLVQQLSQEIRTMSYLLHPPLLDEAGLSEALHWYTQGLIERSGLDIHLEIARDFGRLPREMELLMFRLVQECLTNIHRHSRSKVAAIGITRGDKTLSLDVEDEGKGMSSRHLSEIQAGGGGVGIRGMRERVRQFDGRMAITSNEHGTKFSFRIPIAEPAASEEVTAGRAMPSTSNDPQDLAF
jgi:PAS domain S-box-containing protein